MIVLLYFLTTHLGLLQFPCVVDLPLMSEMTMLKYVPNDKRFWKRFPRYVSYFERKKQKKNTLEKQGNPAVVSFNNGSAFIIRRISSSKGALFEICLWKIDCHEHYVAEWVCLPGSVYETDGGSWRSRSVLNTSQQMEKQWRTVFQKWQRNLTGQCVTDRWGWTDDKGLTLTK